MNTRQLDPKAWLDAVDAKWNSNNIEAALDTFSEDAVAKFVPPPPGAPDVATGREQIRAILEPMLSGFHVESRNHQVVGDRVTWTATATSDLFRGIGVDEIHGIGEAVPDGSRMKSFTITFTPETVARLQEAAAAAGATR